MRTTCDKRGFTLLEVLIVLGISVLLAAVIAELLLVSLRSRDIVWEQLSIQNTGRKTVQGFVNEIRSVNYSSIGSYPIEKAAATEIIFFANIDSDSWRERVRYFVDGTVLKKGVTKPVSTPLSYNSSNEVITTAVAKLGNGSEPVFRYYDNSFAGEESTALAFPVSIPAIRVVGINIIINGANSVTQPLQLSDSATIRNLAQQ